MLERDVRPGPKSFSTSDDCEVGNDGGINRIRSFTNDAFVVTKCDMLHQYKLTKIELTNIFFGLQICILTLSFIHHGNVSRLTFIC